MKLIQNSTFVRGGARLRTVILAMWMAMFVVCMTGMYTLSSAQCSPPSNVSVNNITSSSATVTWNATSSALNYEITYNQQGSSATTTQQTTGSTLFIPNLAPGTLYEVKVRSVCGGGQTSGNANLTFSTQGTACAAPSNLTASAQSPTSLTLNWNTAPGAVNYFISFNPQGNPNVQTVPASAPPFTLSGLQANTNYQISVRSNCGVNGLSNFATVTANPNGTGGGGGGTTCNAPTGLTTSSVGSTTATLNWGPASGASNYEVSYRPNGGSTFTTINSATNTSSIAGLTPSTSYEARVRTVCSGGNFSSFINTTFNTPSQGGACATPNNFRVTETAGTTTTLAWNGVGGAVNYEITYRRLGDPVFTSVTTNNSILTLNNLTTNTDYEARIRTFCGNDVFSAFVTVSFNSSNGNGGGGGTCATPAGFVATNTTSNSSTLSWASVSNAVSYSVRFRVSGGSFSSATATSNSFTLTSLTPGTTYEAFVSANCGTSSSTEASTSFVTSATNTCISPASISASNITGTTATLNWGTVSGVSGFTVEFRKSGDANFTNAGTGPNVLTLTNLNPNTTYEARVRSNCADGSFSNFVNTSFSTGTDQVCPAPAGLQASSVTSSSIIIAFNIVNNALDYELSYRPTGSSNFTTLTLTNATATINNLTASTTYEIRVRSRCVGSVFSDFSSITATTSFGNSSCIAPTNLSPFNVTATSFSVTWANVAGITNYEVQYRRVGDANFINQTVGTNTAIINNTTAGTNYEVRVRSICLNNTFSDFATTTVLAGGSTCASPSNLIINNVSGSSASASWSPGTGISTYEVGIRRVGDVNFTTFSSFNIAFNFSNLNPSTTYEVQVRSICQGANQFSTAISSTFVTTNGTSSTCFAPSGLVTTTISANSASIAWNAVPNITAYEVSYRPTNFGLYTTFVVTNNSTQLIGLTNNTAYEVRVRSVCAGNTFSTYTAANFITSASTGSSCQPPSSLTTVNVNSGGATITWNAVPLALNYEISWRRSNEATYTTANTISSTYLITNLIPGQIYEVRVRSNCGLGLFSNYAAITFTTVASTSCPNPSGLTASNPTNTGITLSWAAVAFNTQVQYEVGYRSVGTGIYITQFTQGTAVVLSNLIPNQTYEWRVRTICASNASSNFSESTFRTADGAGFCSTPTNAFPSQVTQNGARLDWTSVNNVSAYELKLKRNGDTESRTFITSINMYSFGGLIPNSTYQVELRSVCKDGAISLPVTTSFVTLPDLGCNPPSNFMVSNIGLNSALLTWNGAANASAYEIIFNRKGDLQTTAFQIAGNTSSFFLQGLFANTDYDVKIRTLCQNNAVSVTTGMLFSTSAMTQCLTPTRFTAGQITEQSVVLTWDPVTGANSYEVSIRKTGDLTFNGTFVTEKSKSYVNLLPNTEYEVRIRTNCVNNAFSNYASTKFTTALTSNPCLAPELMLTSVTTTVATINWMAIQQSYEIQYRVINGDYSSRLETLAPPYILRDLTPNTTYEVRVRNFCDVRASEFSKVLMFTTPANSCPTPTIAVRTKNSNTISINIADGNPTIEVNYKESGTQRYTRVLTSNNGSYTIAGLLINKNYEIQVRNFCGGVYSDYSNLLVVTTNNLVSTCEVPNLNLASVSGRSVFIAWPTRMTFYELNLRDVKLNETKTTYETSIGSILINNLNPNTAYEVTIRNICGNTFSNASAPLRFTTRAAKEEASQVFNQLSVYPNPNNGIFSVQFTSNSTEATQVSVMDVSGRVVFETPYNTELGPNTIPVELNNVSAGIYMVRLNQNGHLKTVKIVVN